MLINKDYQPDSLQKEGFIHLSLPNQIIAVYNRYYLNKSNLSLLVFSIDENDSLLKFEDTYGRGELFPHYYGSLPISEIIQKTSLSQYSEEAKRVIQEIVNQH